MADNVINLPARGKTYGSSSATGVSVGLEGTVKVFKDIDYSGTSSVKTPRSALDVTCILTRNVSGVALLPKMLVTYKTLYQGRRVDGYTVLDQGIVAGVVDEFLPSTGVANNDLFWLVVRGPSMCLKSKDGNTLAKDDYVVSITAAASTTSTTAGRIMSIAATSNQTNAMSQALNRIGIAMSTSATTNADILVNVKLY